MIDDFVRYPLRSCETSIPYQQRRQLRGLGALAFVSINWRGRPLRTYEAVVGLITNTKNRGGLIMRARLDRRSYPIGRKVSAKGLRELSIDRDDFPGDWNYVIRPRLVQ